MKLLRALTPEQMARAEERLRHPEPGSKIAAAKEYGIDLTLLISQLRLTPAQRAEELEETATALEQVRGIARKQRR
ncbi:MAG TPA: hypothetical protein VH640_14790 [Bryobacteraceae bacterium]